MLIGLTGYAQHGKDTAAAHLVANYGYTRVAFADALKELALKVNPVIPVDPMNPSVTYRLAELVEHASGWEHAKTFPEVRRFLQELGTHARDILGKDVWVQAADLKVMASTTPVVISDVRFPNEADYIRRHSGEVWRIARMTPDGEPFDNGIGTDHASERHVRDIQVRRFLAASNIVELQLGVDWAMQALSSDYARG